MIEKLAKTMYWFGIIYLLAAIVAAIAAYLAALAEEKEACEVAKSAMGWSLAHILGMYRVFL